MNKARNRKDESDKRRNFLGVRWSDDEMDIVSTAAHDRWMAVSPFIRQLVMQALTQKKGERK